MHRRGECGKAMENSYAWMGVTDTERGSSLTALLFKDAPTPNPGPKVRGARNRH